VSAQSPPPTPNSSRFTVARPESSAGLPGVQVKWSATGRLTPRRVRVPSATYPSPTARKRSATYVARANLPTLKKSLPASVETRVVEPLGVEAQLRVESAEAAAEHLAVVLRGEGERGARRLHVVGGAGGGGHHRHQHGGDGGGGGEPRRHGPGPRVRGCACGVGAASAPGFRRARSGGATAPRRRAAPPVRPAAGTAVHARRARGRPAIHSGRGAWAW